jgi:hypothetical protein
MEYRIPPPGITKNGMRLLLRHRLRVRNETLNISQTSRLVRSCMFNPPLQKIHTPDFIAKPFDIIHYLYTMTCGLF